MNNINRKKDLFYFFYTKRLILMHSQAITEIRDKEAETIIGQDRGGKIAEQIIP